MDIEHIMRELESTDLHCPEEALKEACGMPEELTPALLSILRTVLDDPEAVIENENYNGDAFAMLLLACYREKAAYPLVCRIARLLEADEMLGDMITETLPHVLISVFDGDLGPLRAIVEDPEADLYARGSAIVAMVGVFAHGMASREDVINCFRDWYEAGLKDEFGHLMADLALASADMRIKEFLPRIREHYKEGIVDGKYAELYEIEEEISDSIENLEEILKASSKYGLITDPVKEIKWWSAWEEADNEEDYEDWDEDGYEEDDVPVAEGYERDGDGVIKRCEVKVGRNDPCTCGSGKKFKKCCGRV